MKERQSRTGFTLIELMVVVIIIAALAGMVLPRVLPKGDEALARVAEGEMGSIATALNLFRLDMGRYPTEQEGLSALLNKVDTENWKGPYLQGDLEDPWNQGYGYKSTGPYGFQITSKGPSDAPDDDIVKEQK